MANSKTLPILIAFRVDEETASTLRQRARDDDRSMSSVVRRLVQGSLQSNQNTVPEPLSGPSAEVLKQKDQRTPRFEESTAPGLGPFARSNQERYPSTNHVNASI